MSEARSGYQRSVGGLTGALVMALLLIAAIWALSQFQGSDGTEPIAAIDYATQLDEARAQAPFDVLAPAPAPDGWEATSVGWEGVKPEVSWHLGFRTDNGEYVGLEQGNSPVGEFVSAHTPADQPAPPVRIGGETWTSLASDDGDEHAFVLAGIDVITVVTGTAPAATLIDFAESLSDGR
ncbi:MAG: DUF4245 domain-containing protein [Nocardioidaceae bacterium]